MGSSGKGRGSSLNFSRVHEWVAAFLVMASLATPFVSKVGVCADKTAPASLRFRLTGEPATLDWNLARSSHETYVIMNLMEGLVEHGPDLKPRPALAERWDVSADGKTYTFYLKSGVRWSDGKPLKAQDFVDSWLRLLNPKTRAAYASFLFDVENAEAFHSGKLKSASKVGVRALSEQKLEVKLRRVVPYFLHIPTFWVTFPIRQDLIKKHPKDWATPGKILTLGPYRLLEWKKGRAIRLAKNPEYGGTPLPQLDQIEAIIESNDAKARELFEKGQLDFMLDATTGDFLKYSGAKPSAVAKPLAPKIRVQQFPYLATYYLGFNVEHSHLKDAQVRRALALALNREAIPGILQGGQLAAKGWIPPGIEGYDSGASLNGTLYEARGALAKAGYAEGVGIPKLSLWVAKFDGAEALAAYVKKTLRDHLGVEVEPHVGGAAEYHRAVHSKTADLFVGHWGADYPDASNFMEVFRSESGVNSTGFKNADYDRYLFEAGQSLDAKARLVSYAAAERLLLQEAVAIHPLFYRRTTVLLGERVREFSMTPLNYLFLKSIKIGAQ